jgi:hypothetical protein
MLIVEALNSDVIDTPLPSTGAWLPAWSQRSAPDSVRRPRVYWSWMYMPFNCVIELRLCSGSR